LYLEGTTSLELRVESSPVDRLATLFDGHHRRLYRLALRMARDPDVAHDLVQETFLRAARSPGSIPSTEDGAAAWLTRVLVNLCRDRWRKAKVRREAGPAPAWSQRASGTPEGKASTREEVQRALAALRPRTRAVIVMHEIEGRTKEEIAEELGIARVTVRWHLSTGRRRLLEEVGT